MNNEVTKLIEEIFFPHSNSCLERLKKNDTKFSYYTNAETGFKIINNEEIWMRNVRCMNDYSEFLWGRKVMYDALDDENIRKRLNELFSRLGDISFDIFFEKVVKKFIYGAQRRTYITCLSEHDVTDLAERKYGRLSMWRAYGKNSGVALILNNDFLNNSEALGDGAFFITSPVLYEENICEYLNEIIDKMEMNSISSTPLPYELVSEKLLLAIYIATLSIKHPSFKEEREWRIILSFYDNSEVANLKGVVRPSYETIEGIPQRIYKINLKDSILDNADIKSLLNGILIGPVENPYIIKESFEGLLESKQISIDKDLVQISNVPLRK